MAHCYSGPKAPGPCGTLGSGAVPLATSLCPFNARTAPSCRTLTVGEQEEPAFRNGGEEAAPAFAHLSILTFKFSAVAAAGLPPDRCSDLTENYLGRQRRCQGHQTLRGPALVSLGAWGRHFLKRENLEGTGKAGTCRKRATKCKNRQATVQAMNLHSTLGGTGFISHFIGGRCEARGGQAASPKGVGHLNADAADRKPTFSREKALFSDTGSRERIFVWFSRDSFITP